jgi:hypothetical protein
MQKWQYLEMEITVGQKDNSISAILDPAGNHLRSKGDYATTIAQRGLEGWELIASDVRFDSGKHKMNLFFKRPID